jgi:antitoxin VapB
MGLNIKDAETERLASEISALTGETKTGAIRTALRERKQRLELGSPAADRGRILRQLSEELWAAVPADLLGSAPSQAEQDEILGFEPAGA